ncbi:MAG TPA: DUF1150 family protein [Caulobacteraceae bacterium]|nr:DUF1150 family protein [Caulobacteraceae bacterium]
MTPERLSTEAFAALGAPQTVYVRPVTGAELLASTPIESIRGLDIAPDQVLYALHGADGSRLAVMGDKASAVAAAHNHDLSVVSVH